MSKWKTGKTLMTAQTRRWSAQQVAENDKIEGRMIFEGFSARDEGRGRQLVAACESPEQANRIVERIAQLEAELYQIKNAPGGLADDLRLARKREQAAISSCQLIEAELAESKAWSACEAAANIPAVGEYIAELEKRNDALAAELAECKAIISTFNRRGKSVFPETVALAIQCQHMREALENYADPAGYIDEDGNESGEHKLAAETLALSTLPADQIIAKHDAKVLRSAAKNFNADGGEGYAKAWLNKMADELEAKHA